jgi:hypothetical protein
MRKTFLSLGEPCPWFTARSTPNPTALDALPSLPLTDSPTPKREALRATGMDHARSSLGKVLGKIRTSEAIPSHSLTNYPVLTAVAGSTYSLAENPTKPSEKALFAGFANKAFEWSGRELNPRPLHCERSSLEF